MKLTDARAEIERLKLRLFNFSTVTNDEIRNYTGLESSKFFAVVEMIESFQPLTPWSGKTANSLSSSDQLLILLMKKKLDLPYFELAKKFSVSQTTTQNILLTYLNVLHELIFIGCLDQLPSITKNRCSMPESFKDIPNCRIIIDCIEFEIETPRKDLEAAAISYSNYKHRLTAKYLIGVAPNGSITFVSDCYPGSTSDKVVTDQSHLTSNLKVRTYDQGPYRRLFDELAQEKGAIQHLYNIYNFKLVWLDNSLPKVEY